MLKTIVLTIATTACLASSALAQVPGRTQAQPSAQAPAAAPATPPATSAYTGNVGDWAIGRWVGYRYLDAAYTRMTTADRVLVIARAADGNVGCQWGTPASLAKAGWAPCVIDASSIVISPAAGTRVELSRDGAELEGRYYDPSNARNRVHLHRE